MHQTLRIEDPSAELFVFDNEAIDDICLTEDGRHLFAIFGKKRIAHMDCQAKKAIWRDVPGSAGDKHILGMAPSHNQQMLHYFVRGENHIRTVPFCDLSGWKGTWNRVRRRFGKKNQQLPVYEATQLENMTGAVRIISHEDCLIVFNSAEMLIWRHDLPSTDPLNHVFTSDLNAHALNESTKRIMVAYGNAIRFVSLRDPTSWDYARRDIRHVRALALSPDNKHLLVCKDESRIRMMDLKRGTYVNDIATSGAISRIQYAEDGQTCCYVTENREFVIIDIRSGALLFAANMKMLASHFVTAKQGQLVAFIGYPQDDQNTDKVDHQKTICLLDFGIPNFGSRPNMTDTEALFRC